jgi:Ca-activated chloride channel family protein
MLLRDSEYKGDATWDEVLTEAESSLGVDPSGYRQEFLDLVRKAKTLQGH